MLDSALTGDLAEELYRARAEVRTVTQLSRRYPAMDIDDAYSVQRSLVSLMVADGRQVVGRKVGLTSKVMQRAMGIDEPDYGVLTDDMVFADGAEIPHGAFNYPRVELELAFVMAESLEGPGIGAVDVLDATGYVCPAIEILDSRVEMLDAGGHRRTIVDTIADNAADAGVVLGGQRSDPQDIEPRRVGGELWLNGEIEDTGLGTAVLGNPASGVAWLANRLADYGETLESGQIVLSGSLIQSLPVAVGDHVVADFGDHGRASCRFV
ncbi:MAG: 2-oxo-hepta-3-ene-1,7-dioic acid hydratase [Microthrixaceae bacterium]